MRLIPSIAALAMAFAAAAHAHEFKAGDLTIGHPYAIETPATAKSAAGYFSVTNSGSAPDALVAVRADVPMAELHTTETDAAGVTRMGAVEALEIAPGATVTLEPRGLHVMFMGLSAPWKAGDEIPATLVFEKAGEVPVVFDVEPRKGAAAGGMEGMEMEGGGMGPMDHMQHN
jgi:periplasmic copper chaperone A